MCEWQVGWHAGKDNWTEGAAHRVEGVPAARLPERCLFMLRLLAPLETREPSAPTSHPKPEYQDCLPYYNLA